MSNVRRLPGPIADLWDWQRLGLCRGRDSAQFFHPDGERGSSRNRREAKAKTMCGACPVRAECAGRPWSNPPSAIAAGTARRVKPILSTTLTTILGMAPLAVQGGDLWRSLCTVIIFGLCSRASRATSS